MTIFRSICPAIFCATIVGLALLAVPAAQAFTFQDQDTTTKSGGAANLTDLGLSDRHSSRLDDGKQPVTRQGDSTFQFGGQAQTFDQHYDSNRMFNSNTILGR